MLFLLTTILNIYFGKGCDTKIGTPQNLEHLFDVLRHKWERNLPLAGFFKLTLIKNGVALD